MMWLRVAAPLGARLVGPAVLGLTHDQARRRLHILVPDRKRGEWRLPEGTAVTFKRGEIVGLASDPHGQALGAFEVSAAPRAGRA